MTKEELYISLDMEADGEIPGPNSMISFALAAFTKDGTCHGTFTRNLQRLEGATTSPSTMRFWAANKEAYNATFENMYHPNVAMHECKKWLETFHDKGYNLVLVGYPLTYDFMWFYWYMMRFVGSIEPLSFSGIEMKTYAYAYFKGKYKYRHCSKANMPKKWFGEGKHTHIALDDALEQGHLWCNMKKANDE